MINTNLLLLFVLLFLLFFSVLRPVLGSGALSRGPCARSIVRIPIGRVPCLSNILEWFPAHKTLASGGPRYLSNRPDRYSSNEGRVCLQELPTLPIWQALLAKFHSFDFLMFVIWRMATAKLNYHSSVIYLSINFPPSSPIPRARGSLPRLRQPNSSFFTLHSSLVSSSSPPPDRQRCHHKQRTWYHGSGCRADARRHAGSPAAGENEGVKPHGFSTV